MTFQILLNKLLLSKKSTWSVMEMLLLGLCFILPEKTDAHILVYRRSSNQLIEEYNDMPAQFGPSLPPNGLKVYAIPAYPIHACDVITKPPSPPNNYPLNAKFVAIVERGGNCSFEIKVRSAQKATYDAVIVYNNEGDDLETMSAANPAGILIPSVFVGRSTGMNLRSFYGTEVVIIINDELPFNINTQLILPFSILIGLCFLIMIFYMIYKCIREERRLRRHRLPKSMLKKLPVLKFSKNSDIIQETCVICIEDYVEGDKLRMLPCKHVYHTHCIDPWLTENRRVCPICKRKVFTKGETRRNRNRQASLDSVTDTDDDTTPLLQPATTNNANSNNGNRRNNNARNSRNTSTTTTTTTTNANTSRRNNNTSNNAITTRTTRDGTWRDRYEDSASIGNSADITTSDEENALLAQQSPMHSTVRVNPFDRRPNLPPHLAEQLNEISQRSIWSYPIFRLFRRSQAISVAAPPYHEEVIQQIRNTSQSQQQQQQPLSTDITSSQNAELPMPASNNILNPNLSGSFKDQTIYEPITSTNAPTAIVVDPNATDVEVVNSPITQDGDSIFIQTPIQGGIGVVALPNTAFINNRNGSGNGNGNTAGDGANTTRGNDPRFLV